MVAFKKKKSKEEVEWERKLRLRRTRDAVEKYSNKCENLKKRYLDQAVDARRLGNEQMAKRFALRIMALETQLKRAKGFLLMMNDMELSREQLGIWKDLASTFKDFAASYDDQAISFEKMKEVTLDLEKAISNSQQLGDVLDSVLDTMSDKMADFDNVSSKELENIMSTIDEMSVDKEKSSVNIKPTKESEGGVETAETDLDKRIREGIRDIEKEKNEK